MTIKTLTNGEALALFTAYQTALEKEKTYHEENAVTSSAISQLITNIAFIKIASKDQSFSSAFIWRIMSFIIQVPQPTNIPQTLTYNTEQDIHFNIEQLYKTYVNNSNAFVRASQTHIEKNNFVPMGALGLSSFLLILCELISPESAWSVSFLIPLYPTLAIPLLIMSMACLSIVMLSLLQPWALREQINNHQNVRNSAMTFFQTAEDRRNIDYKRIQASFDEAPIAATLTH